MTPPTLQDAMILDAIGAVDEALRALQALNEVADLRCRALSLAITNVEQGLHWLHAFFPVLEDE
jgi:hypothetical protein